jgi:hypothetical protein
MVTKAVPLDKLELCIKLAEMDQSNWRYLLRTLSIDVARGGDCWGILATMYSHFSLCVCVCMCMCESGT